MDITKKRTGKAFTAMQLRCICLELTDDIPEGIQQTAGGIFGTQKIA
jgi:hypothetical protein